MYDDGMRARAALNKQGGWRNPHICKHMMIGRSGLCGKQSVHTHSFEEARGLGIVQTPPLAYMLLCEDHEGIEEGRGPPTCKRLMIQ